jgi:hypothetical protein
MAITAIETFYGGCRFRSRLEARWAVFFDTLGLKWEYEPEGYTVKPWDDKPARRYLPDFYLPTSETWVEVKGCNENADWELLVDFVDYESPLPGVHESFDPWTKELNGSTRGLLLLGPIPHAPNAIPVWSILQHHKGIYRVDAVFCNYGLRVAHSSDDTADGPAVPRNTSFNAHIIAADPRDTRAVSRAAAAYTAARSARFEHGESGASWH